MSLPNDPLTGFSAPQQEGRAGSRKAIATGSVQHHMDHFGMHFFQGIAITPGQENLKQLKARCKCPAKKGNRGKE